MRLQSCEKAMDWCTAQCEMLLVCVKTIVKEPPNFELAHGKKKKKEKYFGRWATFCFGAFAMFFQATGHVFQPENIPR